MCNIKSPSEQEELSSSFEKTMAGCLGAYNDLSRQELVQDRGTPTTSQFRNYLSTRTPMPTPLQTERVLRCPPKGSPSAHHIRSRFLNRLGISKTTQTPQSTTLMDTTTRKKRSDSFQEILKADHGKPGSLSSSSDTDTTLSVMSSSYSSSTSTTDNDDSTASSSVQQKRQRRRSVHFDDAVTVHPIPSHTLYSERIRSTLWPTALEMQENVARNIVEYTAEDWDWHHVVEDDDMVLCQGERIHPIHFIMAQQAQQQQQQYSMQEHFLTVMAAQQKQYG